MATIDGTIYDDTLTGTPAADSINGGAGNDRITGGGGNDVLTGSGETDIAMYSGRQAGYVFSVGAGCVLMVRDFDPLDGNDGIDQLTGIQNLSF